MKVLIIGSGGREHALGLSIKKSPKVKEIFFTPGNGGTSEIGQNVNIEPDDIEDLLNFAILEKIDLTVVGPEVPLSLGIADLFNKNNLRIFAPSKEASKLETSKIYAKRFMEKYNIPTAKFSICKNINEAMENLDKYNYPVVIKADGLASGKGVIICNDFLEAQGTLKNMMIEKKFGDAGENIVIEEFLEGKEASILCFVDGKTIKPMVSAQDYKRAYDFDKGLNTGGMGAISPAFYYTDEMKNQTEMLIIQKTLDALKKENIDYKGVLYFGLMLTKNGPFVIEYNTRFGDPETEVVLMRLETDIVDIFQAVIDEKLLDINIAWKEDKAICVVLASAGYPEAYEKNHEITGLDEIFDATIFHSGTVLKNNKLLTSGGRVLVVSTLGKSEDEIRRKIYKQIEKIKFNKMFYRKDIGLR